jgi:hypothetical protein
MRIAIFADVHGRILLAFKLVDRYQRETGNQIDLILQCGDMGIFPDRSRMDNRVNSSSESARRSWRRSVCTLMRERCWSGSVGVRRSRANQRVNCLAARW